jgi:hypothetical protein
LEAAGDLEVFDLVTPDSGDNHPATDRDYQKQISKKFHVVGLSGPVGIRTVQQAPIDSLSVRLSVRLVCEMGRLVATGCEMRAQEKDFCDFKQFPATSCKCRRTDLTSAGRKAVGVQVPFWAPSS